MKNKGEKKLKLTFFHK